MRYLLDSGDPDEYKTIAQLAKENRSELWGSTTNPSLIAKKLSGKKITHEEALQMQKDLVMQILEIVPGAVSAEVYADKETTAEQMIEQGREIATWNERIYVKLPTTIEGFKARTQLRKEKIPNNNTLVFSQEQIFAICLHEDLVQKQFGPIENTWPCFISPFVGRLDDIGLDGMQLVEHGMTIKQQMNTGMWMLEASVRRLEHMKRGEHIGSELVTVPKKTYEEWFSSHDGKESPEDVAYAKDLSPIPQWDPGQSKHIATLDEFMDAITSGSLNIQHDLTDKGLDKFATDWKELITT